ncbi:hypothetical protein GCM10023205_47540 [Yinghuangia aomiensis]|uniref:Uncharacterized protein n=1 Tax=Yinghuangia aomiensis TaxID=676205 RepID=A0ABP9HPJ8_9ACTN
MGAPAGGKAGEVWWGGEGCPASLLLSFRGAARRGSPRYGHTDKVDQRIHVAENRGIAAKRAETGSGRRATGAVERRRGPRLLDVAGRGQDPHDVSDVERGGPPRCGTGAPGAHSPPYDACGPPCGGSGDRQGRYHPNAAHHPQRSAPPERAAARANCRQTEPASEMPAAALPCFALPRRPAFGATNEGRR